MNGWRVLDESGVEYNAEGEAAWMKAEIIDASDPAIVGQWVAGAVFDGGTPGKNGDLVFQVSPVDSGIADLFYDYGIMGIQLYPFWAPVVKGNLVVK